jgi:glucose-6-phosphate isomerase
MYASLQTIQYMEKGKPISILMPFSEQLKSTADWYCQLLAESTGKKFSRAIKTDPSGREIWQQDKDLIVNVGRTPVPSRGTNDLHSIQQNNIEGENDKVVTFIRVQEFSNDIAIPGDNDLLSGKKYSRLLSLAQEATEWALVRQERPNCTIIMPRLSAFAWGELIFFFEMATAFEGELLNINAFDQPGVEGYKNYMYYKLGKPGLPGEIEKQIRQNPLVKKPRFII